MILNYFTKLSQNTVLTPISKSIIVEIYLTTFIKMRARIHGGFETYIAIYLAPIYTGVEYTNNTFT